MMPHEFTFATVCELSTGQKVALVCPTFNDLERAWNQITRGRVPIKREMVQRVRIEKGNQ